VGKKETKKGIFIFFEKNTVKKIILRGERMKKKQLGLFLISGALVVGLAACGNNLSNGKIPNAQATSDKGTQLTKSEGTFSGRFDDTHIDITENGTKRMFQIVDEMKDTVKAMKVNDKITFAYESTESGENVIHLITDLNGNTPKTTTKKSTIIRDTSEETTKKTVAKKETETDKEKESEKEEKETNKVDSSAIFKATLAKGFTGEDNRIYYTKDKEMYGEISFLDANIVVKEQRWSAADELKKNGPLSELFGSNIPSDEFKDAAFVFTSSSNRYTQYVVLEKKSGYYVRYFVSIPKEENNVELEYDLWNSLATVTKK